VVPFRLRSCSASFEEASLFTVRIVVDYRSALRHRSGAGEYAHQLVRALAADRHADDTITVFSSSWKDRLDATGLGQVDAIDRRVPNRILTFLWHRAEWPAIERFAGAVDVAHSFHPLLMPARRAAQVVTIHDLDFLGHPERTRAEIRRDYPALAGSHARRADRVIVSSRYAAGEVSRLLEVPRERITLCPAGAPDWTPRGERPADGHILFLGTLEPRKNIGRLLDAYGTLVARHPDTPPLVLAGKATPDAAAWLAAIERAPLAGRVNYRGYVPDSDRKALYEKAVALVLPSLEEGFGMTALEAMAVGVPVVASDRGSLPEVVGDAGLLVDPERTDALAAALDRVVSDEGLARRLTDAGLVRARSFSWQSSAQILRDAYREAVGARAHRG
jgi:glycosyltransferase involved in cell wall biosynthesis